MGYLCCKIWGGKALYSLKNHRFIYGWSGRDGDRKIGGEEGARERWGKGEGGGEGEGGREGEEYIILPLRLVMAKQEAPD